jgi:CO/xanthine dehydrogenase Mo-binding subunit
VITGVLVGYEPERIEPRAAAEPKAKLRNRNNAVPSYLAGCVGDICAGAGSIRSERVITRTVAGPFFTGPLRSPLRLQNTFAHEGFMDEICAQVKADPVAFRLQHLRDERLAGVVKAAAQAAQWENRPSPKPKIPRTGLANGRGVACVAYEGDNGYAALVADVNVDVTSGSVRPRKFTVAVDCGPISNPDGLRNQTEGGVLQGMSRALLEEVTWDAKRVTSVDWETYNSLFLGSPVPEIDVILVNKFDVPATGGGELAITLAAAAIGNAIFDATGVRLRQAPFTSQRVKDAYRSLA